MKLRKLVVSVPTTLAVAILVVGFMLFRKLDLPPLPLLKEGGLTPREAFPIVLFHRVPVRDLLQFIY